MLVSAETLPFVAIPTIWRLATLHAKPVVLMNEGDIDLHLYCIHSVTGDVAGLDRLARHFGPVRLHGIQVPKRDMNQIVSLTIEAVARRHVALIETFQPSGPVRLIGWSAGAIIALEMAQQLRALGRDVPLLVALDGAPCNTGAGLSWRDPRYLLRMIANLPRWVRDDRTSDWSAKGIRARLSEKLAARSQPIAFRDVDTLDADAIEGAIAKPGWSPAQKAFVRAMYQALSAYVPQRYAGRVLAFETGTQPLLHQRQVGAAWRSIAATLKIVPVRGNHSMLIHEDSSAFLAAAIRRELDAGC